MRPAGRSERQGAYTPKLNIRQPSPARFDPQYRHLRVHGPRRRLDGQNAARPSPSIPTPATSSPSPARRDRSNAFARGLTTKQFDALQNDIDKPLINRALRGAYPPARPSNAILRDGRF